LLSKGICQLLRHRGGPASSASHSVLAHTIYRLWGAYTKPCSPAPGLAPARACTARSI